MQSLENYNKQLSVVKHQVSFSDSSLSNVCFLLDARNVFYMPSISADGHQNPQRHPQQCIWTIPVLFLVINIHCFI